MSLLCNNCGKENKDILKFCSDCGEALQPSSPLGPLHAGKILETRYKIIVLIKVGSMGAVYKAMDTKFDSICAVKELLPSYGSPEEQTQSTEWFKREARLLNALDHPNLPKVFDYFVRNGRYYLVMNFITGEDLETILEKEGKPGLPWERVIEWSKQIMQVLDYLHNQNPPVIYRDLKPSNIMLHKDGRIMLIDFGIARSIRKDGKAPKTAIGTDGYAPIEQCSGNAEPRSDLYALGATMHQLLTGIEPKLFTFEPLRKIIPTIPPEIERVVMKAVEYELKDRFASAKDMLHALSSNQKVTAGDYKKNYKTTDLPSLKQLIPVKPVPVPSPEMELISDGAFQMGSSPSYESKTPFHQVTLSSYYMSKYAVTNKEYCVFLNSQGNQIEEDVMWINTTDNDCCGIVGGPSPGTFIVKSGFEARPVVYVTWYGAVAYCNWLSEEENLTTCYGPKDNRGDAPYSWRLRSGYRLPTEAEWEYACRGGTTASYYWGDDMKDEYCWYMNNSGGKHHPVGLKKTNPFGLYDMSGNVYEWCNDWFGEYLTGSVPNPTGPLNGTNRVVRGGSWALFASFCRSASRFQLSPDVCDDYVGFRLARSEQAFSG